MDEWRAPRDRIRAMHTVVIAGIVIAVLLPAIPLVIWSLSGGWWFPRLLPEQWSLRSWRYLASPASRVAEATRNSVIIALATTAVSVPLGVPAGRALGLYRFRGKRFAEALVFAPLIVPALAVIMGVQVVLIRAGISATLGGVVVAHLLPALPYMVMVMRAVFSAYDPEYEQQARSLGASRWETLLHVTVPAVLPGVVTGALFVFLISWSQYALTLLVGGGRIITLPVLLFAFVTAGDHAMTGAVSLLFLAPALLILVVSARMLGGRSAGVSGLEGA